MLAIRFLRCIRCTPISSSKSFESQIKLLRTQRASFRLKCASGPQTIPLFPFQLGAIKTVGHCTRSEAKAAEDCRTYSSPKVIHRGRGAALLPAPQPSVNNFGGDAQNHCEQLSLWLNRRVGHAGSGRRIPHSNVTTFFWRASLRDPAPCRKGILRTLRLQVQKLAETNLYKCFPPARTACPTKRLTKTV